MTLFEGITFANPQVFWLLLILPLLPTWIMWRRKKLFGKLVVPTTAGLPPVKPAFNVLRHAGTALRMIAITLLITALARPQSALSWEDATTEGIDIIIATDISGSMLSEDLKPNRLEAGKEIAVDFIKGRPHDRIGLVVFSGESFTQCPLTIDHDVLINLFKDISNGMIRDGTAIGMGLATATNRLKESDAQSKVIILLTDGSNTTGSIAPVTAAEIAQQFNIRIYTVGVGTEGTAPYPVQTPFGVQYQQVPVTIDEETLTQIADLTGGKYFRATNNEKLKAIYREIDQLEKAKIAVTHYQQKTERFFPFALGALLLLLVDFGLRHSILKGALT